MKYQLHFGKKMHNVVDNTLSLIHVIDTTLPMLKKSRPPINCCMIEGNESWALPVNLAFKSGLSKSGLELMALVG